MFIFQIKLVNINVSDIADGKPSIVLGLIWTIILYFQVSINNEIHVLKCIYTFVSNIINMSLPLMRQSQQKTLFSSAEMFKKPLREIVWTQIRLLL